MNEVLKNKMLLINIIYVPIAVVGFDKIIIAANKIQIAPVIDWYADIDNRLPYLDNMK